MLYGVEDVNKLAQLLETVAEKSKFTFKLINKNNLRISSEDIQIYKQIMSLIREQGLIGHTFIRKDGRNCRLAIRNLHHTTPHVEITRAFEESGNTVIGEIINARFGPEKKPTSTFFVNLLAGPNNKAAKQVKVIYHQVVTIEDPKKRTSPVQCQRCQQYGHSKNYCMRPYRCLKCAGPHITRECPKTDRKTPATCALCLGPHPSKYKGCEVFKEILARKSKNLKSNERIIQKNNNKAFEELLSQPQIKKDATNTKPSLQYAAALKKPRPQAPLNQMPLEQTPQTNISKLEELFLKQSDKIDTILQQMSTLLGLITTLVSKLIK